MPTAKYVERYVAWGAFFLAPPIVVIFLRLSGFTSFEQKYGFYDLLLVLVVFPVTEELVFRGLILEFLHSVKHCNNTVGRISCANFYTSILFSLFHLFHHSFLWAFLVFFPSLVLGFMKEKTGSMVVVISAHAYFNLCWVLSSVLDS